MSAEANIKLRASEYWSRMIKTKKSQSSSTSRDRSQADTTASLENDTGRRSLQASWTEVAPTIRSTHRSNCSPGNFAADAAILGASSPIRKLTQLPAFLAASPALMVDLRMAILG